MGGGGGVKKNFIELVKKYFWDTLFSKIEIETIRIKKFQNVEKKSYKKPKEKWVIFVLSSFCTVSWVI